MSKFKRPAVMAAAVSSLALAGIVPTALARHGGDDPVGHDDHGGRVTVKAHAPHGADDRGRHHHRHRHGNDDGAGHR